MLAISVIAIESSSQYELKEVAAVVEETATVEEAIALTETELPPIKSELPEYQSVTYSRDWDADEAYLLAKIAMAEAENQDTEGKALVICVVLNRVWVEEFPDSIEAVIYQDRQFSPVANGRFDNVEPNQDCWDALSMVKRGWDESQGALYFESESSSTWHREHLQFLFQHEDHMFYTDKE